MKDLPAWLISLPRILSASMGWPQDSWEAMPTTSVPQTRLIFPGFNSFPSLITLCSTMVSWTSSSAMFQTSKASQPPLYPNCRIACSTFPSSLTEMMMKHATFGTYEAILDPSELMKYFSVRSMKHWSIRDGTSTPWAVTFLSMPERRPIFDSGSTSSIFSFSSTLQSATLLSISENRILSFRPDALASLKAVSATASASSLVHLLVEAKPSPPSASTLTLNPQSTDWR